MDLAKVVERLDMLARVLCADLMLRRAEFFIYIHRDPDLKYRFGDVFDEVSRIALHVCSSILPQIEVAAIDLQTVYRIVEEHILNLRFHEAETIMNALRAALPKEAFAKFSKLKEAVEMLREGVDKVHDLKLGTAMEIFSSVAEDPTIPEKIRKLASRLLLRTKLLEEEIRKQQKEETPTPSS